MDRLKIFDARQGQEADDENRETNNEAGDGPCDTDVEHHASTRYARARLDHCTERPEVRPDAKQHSGKWNVKRQRRRDVIQTRSDEVPELMSREEEQEHRPIEQSFVEVLQVERIEPKPCNASDGRRKKREQKKDDVQYVSLRTEEYAE